MTNARVVLLLSVVSCVAMPALAQISGGNCSASNLNGTYTLSLTGRAISSAGSFAGSFQGVGTATFDGQSNVTFAGISNTNQATGTQFNYSGTYTVPSNCYGTITLNAGSTATFTLVVWSNGRQFAITGADATYTYAGNGGNFQPVLCGTPTLSGEFTYTLSGFTLSGTAQTGAGEEAGVFQFDGQGNVTASYTFSSAGTTPASITATGSYTVTSNCSGSATLTDSTAKTNTLNFVIAGGYGDAIILLAANSQFVRAGAARSAFTNPTESIANVASYAVNFTPPGSVFVLFGVGLAPREQQATRLPLPTTLQNTTVTVNGELAPLFYVNTGQIDAQMPWDIQGGTVASVIVKNGTAASNAAAVYVPATGTPGISVYSNNRAVVVNQDNSVNSGSAGAHVGDEVVAYFTGGGPVQDAASLVSGQAAPGALLVLGNNSVTVGGVPAIVKYVGLTPGSVGLYQANFIVPQLDRGTYQVVITINGAASNKPVMTVSD